MPSSSYSDSRSRSYSTSHSSKPRPSRRHTTTPSSSSNYFTRSPSPRPRNPLSTNTLGKAALVLGALQVVAGLLRMWSTARARRFAEREAAEHGMRRHGGGNATTLWEWEEWDAHTRRWVRRRFEAQPGSQEWEFMTWAMAEVRRRQAAGRREEEEERKRWETAMEQWDAFKEGPGARRAIEQPPPRSYSPTSPDVGRGDRVRRISDRAYWDGKVSETGATFSDDDDYDEEDESERKARARRERRKRLAERDIDARKNHFGGEDMV